MPTGYFGDGIVVGMWSLCFLFFFCFFLKVVRAAVEGLEGGSGEKRRRGQMV